MGRFLGLKYTKYAAITNVTQNGILKTKKRKRMGTAFS